MPTLRLAPLPALLGALLCFVAPARAATLNVPTPAYPTIQAAVNASQNGDTVLIADGTYSGDGNRDIDFGGKNITVTSQHGPANTIIDCGGSDNANHRGFYIHSGETDVVISGFTVRRGYEAISGGGICIVGSGALVQNCIVSGNTTKVYGGGIFNDNVTTGTIAVTDCTVLANAAQEGGGGIYNVNSSTGIITMTGCTVSGNTARNEGGGGVYNLNSNQGVGTITVTDCSVSSNTTNSYGGGVYNDNYYDGDGTGTITMTGCTVSGNTALKGGGVYDHSGITSTITLMGCTVSANTAQTNGGGVFNFNDLNDNATIALTNCTISANIASVGGGVQNFNYGVNGIVILANCTVSANTAQQGNGIFNDNFGVNGTGTITLINCILFGDSGIELANDANTSAAAAATYCDVQGGYTGTGNIDADPLFVNAAGGNLHLRPGSPCLGAGTSAGAPTTDLDGHTRPNPPSIGAYEVAAPGHTHLLWTNTNGAAAIWTVNPDGTVTSTPAYGPIPGWTAKTIADGPDGKTRLLWRRTDGMSAVWTVNTADGTITSTPGYAPQGGWITVGLAVGPDNLTRLQWEIDPYKRVGLANAVWTLDGAGNVTSTPPYRPDGFWTATALAVGGDGLSRLLWVNGGVPSGQYPFAVWTLNAVRVVASTPLYRPQPDAAWTASAIAGGPDANARLLLNRTDGSMAVWTVDVPGSVASTPLYGPIPGWTCHALAVGPDALSRVLWSRADGMSSVWTISADGSIASTPGYGPYSGWSAVALSVGP